MLASAPLRHYLRCVVAFFLSRVLNTVQPTQAFCSSEPTISIRDRTLGGLRRASTPSGALFGDKEDYGSHHRGPAHVIFMGSMNLALCGLFLRRENRGRTILRRFEHPGHGVVLHPSG